jgi:hypothetical protein
MQAPARTGWRELDQRPTMACAQSSAGGGAVPTIFLYWREGRSQAARDKLADALAEAVASVPEAMAGKDEVDVFFFEVPVGYMYHGGQALPSLAPRPDEETER